MQSRIQLGYTLGLVGASLGALAGIVQWAFGDEIPEWTGNKLHPVQLGMITILLSLLAAACVTYLARNADATGWRRGAAILLIGAAAGICFTTVGRLWYVPGPLLLVAAAYLAQSRGG
jgi:hypothetical protein